MFDGAKANLARVREAEYRPCLEPGEPILATGLVQPAFIGADAIETSSEPDAIERAVARARDRIDQLPPLPKGFVAVAGTAAAIAAVATDPLPSLDLDPSRLLGGRVGQGAVGSIAAQVKVALAGTVDADLLVTDRRVAIAVPSDTQVHVEGLALPVTPRRLAVSVPRAAIRGVRRRRRPLEWGRLELAFIHGVDITLTAGIISGRRARRLVDAITQRGIAPP